LSPSPDYLKVIDVQGKKTSFSLSSFLEKLPRDFFSHQEVSSPKVVPLL
jgi:sorting nexin-25